MKPKFQVTPQAKKAYKLALDAAVRARDDKTDGQEYFFHPVDAAVPLGGFTPEERQLIVCSAITAVLTHCEDVEDAHPYSRTGAILYNIISASVHKALVELRPELKLTKGENLPAPRWCGAITD